MEGTYQIKRSTVIYFIAFLLVCFLANFFAVSILLRNSESLLKDRTAELENKIATLESTTQQKIRDVDPNRAETNFTFVIRDAQNFLNSKARRGSEFFYCRSMRFFLSTQHLYFEDDYYLSVFLYRFNPSDDFYYSMQTDFELRLLNQAGKPDRVLREIYTFEKRENENRGQKQFIRISDLTNIANGWIHFDELKLQVKLKCEEFRRTN